MNYKPQNKKIMRKTILLTAVAVLAIISAKAQDYKAVLQKTFTAFDTTKDLQPKTEDANKLTLIAKKWDKEWITHYYVAFSDAVLSYLNKDVEKRDAYLDDAEKEHDAAVSILGKENDETYVLAAMIANARLAVKPMDRYMKYGKIFTENMDKAKEINADNPRIYFLEGMGKYHTPTAFGGGKKAALPYFEKADGLYAKEKDDDIAKPYWGKETNAYMLSQSKNGDKE
jgi:hypothetical protein